MAILTTAQLETIKKHRYRGADESLLSKYVLVHWWEFVTRLMPRWLAYAPVRHALPGVSARGVVRWGPLTLGGMRAGVVAGVDRTPYVAILLVHAHNL